MVNQSSLESRPLDNLTSRKAPVRRPQPRRFCPLCTPGNHAHADAYGRPEYHCPSSRPWVGWHQVSFRAGMVMCSCEHGRVQEARGLPARCLGHAQYVLWAIGNGKLPAPDEIGGFAPCHCPRIVWQNGYELFEAELAPRPSRSVPTPTPQNKPTFQLADFYPD